MVIGVGLRMGILDFGGDRRRGRAILGVKFGASHCNQWGLCDALFSNYFEDLLLCSCMEYREERFHPPVFPHACLRNHRSKPPNYTLPVAVARSSSAAAYVMYFRFVDDVVFLHSTMWRRDATAAASLQCRARYHPLLCGMVLVAYCLRRRPVLHRRVLSTVDRRRSIIYHTKRPRVCTAQGREVTRRAWQMRLT